MGGRLLSWNIWDRFRRKKVKKNFGQNSGIVRRFSEKSFFSHNLVKNHSRMMVFGVSEAEKKFRTNFYSCKFLLKSTASSLKAKIYKIAQKNIRRKKYSCFILNFFL